MHTDTPTHFPFNNTTPTTLDFIINKNINGISNLKTLHELSSDHDPIIFNLNTKAKTNLTLNNLTSYNNTNWAAFRKTLDTKITITPLTQIKTITDIDNQVKLLTNNIQTTLKKHTTTYKLKPKTDKIPDEIRTLITRRNNTRRHWQRTQQPADLQQLKMLNKIIRYEIHDFRNSQWQEKLTQLNPHDNSLWKLNKILKKPFKAIPTLQHENKTHYTDKEKCNIIATTFEKVHHIPPNTPEQNEITQHVINFLTAEQPIDKIQLESTFTTPHELRQIIRKLPNRKAPGPDKIQYITIKNLSRKAHVQFTHIVNATILLQYFPKEWKKAVIIPISKPNKNSTHPTSYRPISLLNTLSKITEKIILHRLQLQDIKYKITPPTQFGFRPQHNTIHQVARIITDTTLAFNKKQSTSLILLDFEKAFDKVWIAGLIYKLIKIGIDPVLIKYIWSYLGAREFVVKIGSETSDTQIPLAGVPQGSVLGPKLYTLYLHDIPHFTHTNTAMYADDTAIYAHSHSAQIATAQLQIHINILLPYYNKWKLQVNYDKTQAITLTRKFKDTKIHTPINLSGHKTSPSLETKYLGVILDKRLRLKPHIQHTIKKVNFTIKSLYSIINKNSKLSIENKRLLYTSVLRPIMTYAAPVWCGIASPEISKIQRLQNKCLRLVTNSDRYTRITYLHDTTNIEYIHPYINKLANSFYQTQINNNPLIKNITHYKQHNTPASYKHKLPYQSLSIFQQPSKNN